MSRCLQSLEAHKRKSYFIARGALMNAAVDLKTISRFAQMEYKLGDPERGKTIFEGIIDSHPKRWDMWSIYMDMEAGEKDIQTLRLARVYCISMPTSDWNHSNLFQRVFLLKMTSHKAK